MSIFRSTLSMEQELQKQYNHCSLWIDKIQNAPDNLIGIMHLHSEMWMDGMQHPNFGPDPYGMFRTNDIAGMNSKEVFLGDIDGIWTNSIYEFERDELKFCDVKEGNIVRKAYSSTYKVICNQYKNHLLTNLKAMRSNIYDHGFSRDRMMAYVRNGMNKTFESGISDIVVLNKSIEDDKVLNVRMTVKGNTIESSLLLANDIIYIPEGFEKGVEINDKNVRNLDYYTVFNIMNGNGRTVQLPKEALSHGLKIDGKDLDMSRAQVKGNLEHISHVKKQKGMKF